MRSGGYVLAAVVKSRIGREARTEFDEVSVTLRQDIDRPRRLAGVVENVGATRKGSLGDAVNGPALVAFVHKFESVAKRALSPEAEEFLREWRHNEFRNFVRRTSLAENEGEGSETPQGIEIGQRKRGDGRERNDPRADVVDAK